MGQKYIIGRCLCYLFTSLNYAESMLLKTLCKSPLQFALYANNIINCMR